MTSTDINNKIANGTIIHICPWDTAFTNTAKATVLEVADGRVVRYRVEDCESTIIRRVSLCTWLSIIEQAK